MPKVKVIQLEDGNVVLEEVEEETTDEISYLPFKPGDARCTCTDCPINGNCMYAWDDYNTDGDCLLEK